jgi:DNA-binding CsgD family transcriptional regulator
MTPDAAAADRVAAMMPPSVERWVAAHLQRLPEPERRLAETVAVLGPGIDLPAVAAVADLPVAEASRLADDLARAALLTDQRPVQFAHPLVEAAVRDAIPAGRRAALHRAAHCVLIALPEHRRRALNHAMLCEPSGDAALAAALRAAAPQADPRTAVVMLRRAAREEPDGPGQSEWLQALGTAELAAGDDNGLQTLQRAREGLTDPRRRVAIDLQVGIAQYERGRVDEAARTLRRGAEEPLAEDDELRVSLQAAEMTVVRALPDPSAEQTAIGGRLDALLARQDPGRTSVERLVLAQAAFRGVQSGDVDYREMLALGRRALPPVADPDRFDALALPLAAMSLYLSDEVEQVESRLTEEIERAQRSGEPLSYATASFFRGFPRFLRGDLLDAEADFQAALDAAQDGWAFALPSAHALRAMCAIERDDLAAAGRLLALPDGDDRWRAHPTFPVLQAIRALWHNCEGRHEEAMETIMAAGSRQEMLGAHNPSVLHWRVEAAETALALGEPEMARALSAEAVTRARRFGAPRALGLALRAAGQAHDGEAGVALLRESVAVLERSRATLELARSRAVLGSRLRSDGHDDEAIELLQRALRGAERCGGTRLRRLVAAELAVAGADALPARTALAESLSPTERRIAELTVEGNSSTMIAQQLFVTRHRVETHLARTYSKLGIDGRTELLAALDDTAVAER